MTIETRREGSSFYITLNRPHKKNAIDDETYKQLANTLYTVNNDPEIVFVVVTGKGDFFTSGSDFDPSKVDFKKTFDTPFDPAYFNLVSQLIDHSKILIALVNGPSIGIGATILGLFDLVIASEKAYFMTPFTKLGLAVEGTSSYTFPYNIGRINASRMLLFSEKISAQEAKQFGLVSHVVPHENFYKNCQPYLDQLKQLAPESLLQSKARMINDAIKKELRHSHVEEKDLLTKRWQSPELFQFMERTFGKKSKI